MKVTWNWLREFVDLEMPVTQVAERLSMAGLEVDSIEERARELADVVCGEIVQVRPHPNAERLLVCDVRAAGEATASVVCGASNARAGTRIAYAPPGSTLPGGRRIETADVRGVTSAGMLCSEAELGIGTDASGILILPNESRIGDRVAAVLGLEDTVLDISITPNRGDCLSILGIAREIAALTGTRLRRQRLALRESDDPAADLIAIRIADTDLCGRYVGRIISNIKIGASPRWLRYRLEAVGMRPINNVVDVTNYVMIERGQPLHAFDYDRLPQREIVVRRAGNDTAFTTLDAQVRTLHRDDLMIASGDQPIAIAGVMGGADSEVTLHTQRILLESAWFAPVSVRRTAKRLGLRTEASYRFERTTDIDEAPLAADRAAALIARLSGGTVARGRVDAYPSPRPAVAISLRLRRVDELLGLNLGRSEVISKLKALGVTVMPGSRGTLNVVPPSHRADLSREIDVIEEIVRLVGYENVPTTLPQCGLLGTGLCRDERRERDVKRFLATQGLSEVIPLSFCSPRLNGLFAGLGERRTPVTILNPVTQEDTELRLSLCSGLVQTVRANLDQGASAVGVFCIGKVFWRDGNFSESRRLAAAICPTLPGRGMGRRAAPAEFIDIKGVVEALFEFLGVGEASWLPAADLPEFHPGQTARVVLGGTPVGVVGALHPASEEDLKISGPCWLFELDLDRLLQYCPARIVYRDLPRFPAVVRDVAVVTEESFASDRVVQFIREWSTPSQLIEEVSLFDQYIGPPIPAGKKSLAYSLSYRAADRTLTDAEVNDMHARLIAALQNALPVEPR